VSIYKIEQRDLNQAFDAEGNFDELNNQITRLTETEKSKRVEEQLNQMRPLPLINIIEVERSITNRRTMILNLSDIQAALRSSESNVLNQEQNTNNSDVEISETQKELNKAFSQK